MKIIIIGLMMLLLGFVIGRNLHPNHHPKINNKPVVQASPFVKGRPGSPTYWEEKKSFFDQFVRQADIVMVGDSLTDGAEWADIYPQARIVNRAIGGDTTAGVLERMNNIYSVKPKKVFLMIGINDVFSGEDVDIVVSNYAKIVDQLKRKNIHVYIESTLLCNPKMAGEWAHCAESNEKVKVINQRISQLGDFIDLNSKLSDKDGLKAEFTNDGVHLLGNGYLAWKHEIDGYIN